MYVHVYSFPIYKIYQTRIVVFGTTWLSIKYNKPINGTTCHKQIDKAPIRQKRPAAEAMGRLISQRKMGVAHHEFFFA
jgi:hypothetical protein